MAGVCSGRARAMAPPYAAAVTRDMPEEAARVLRELGYKVEFA